MYAEDLPLGAFGSFFFFAGFLTGSGASALRFLGLALGELALAFLGLTGASSSEAESSSEPESSSDAFGLPGDS